MTSFGDDLDEGELKELLADVFKRTGYDFRDYSLSSMRRRIQRILDSERLGTIRELRERFLYDAKMNRRFVEALSVPTTEMFRDPAVFKIVRQKLLPNLKDVPLLRIWSMGCSTGEEAYSIAILLEEEGLYERSRIYATDMNEMFLQKAKEGIFPLRLMQDYTSNYLDSGGCADFSGYYTVGYDSVVFHERLKRNIVFSHHNVAIDQSFNEFSMIFCRNVLIYFNSKLQERVYDLIDESLAMNGYLVLGEKEALRSGTARGAYEQVQRPHKVFRRLKKS